MRVAALLSGGKDSVAAVEVARDHGWDVACALCLRPEADDAWIFHTPNLDVVAAVAQCLGLDLHEAPCPVGGAEEETALEAALGPLRDRYRLDGVVSGALQSEYQRTRIDRVGHRLGLKTFGPLWHKDVHSYMKAFTGPLWDVRFARVAAEGMDASWCGRPLDGPAMHALAEMPRRIHLAGEGGEYETLVLDAPHYRRRIVVEAAHMQEDAHRATWHVQRWRTETKAPPPPRAA